MISRKWGIRILVLYCGLLIASGWPVESTRLILSTVARSAGHLLYHTTLVPGQMLFTTSRDQNLKTGTQCFQFKWLNSQQETLRREEVGTGCRPPNFVTWWTDPREIMLYRVFERAAEARRTWPGFPPTELAQKPNLNEFSILASVADYFCHSKKYRDQRTSELHFAWRLRLGLAGEFPARDQFGVIAKWECDQHRFLQIQWNAPVVGGLGHEFESED